MVRILFAALLTLLVMPGLLIAQAFNPAFPAPYANQAPAYGPPIPTYNQAAQSPPFVAGISVRPWFLSGKFVILQDGLPDISLNSDFGFPNDYTAWQIGVIAGRAPIRLGYSYIPFIRGSGSTKLGTSLLINTTRFGGETTTTTTSNDPVFLEAQVARHRIEFAVPLQAGAGGWFVPRIGGEFYPWKVTARSGTTKTDSAGGTVGLFTLGAAYEQRFPFFILTLAGDWETGSKVRGYDLDISGTIFPSDPQSLPVFLTVGYFLQQTQASFGGGSVSSDARGAYIQGELRF